MRANVFNHWYYPYYKSGSYAADNRGLGAYRIVKRKGQAEVKLRVLACKGIGDDDWTLRAEIGGLDRTTTVSATTPTYYDLDWSLGAEDTADECEWELKIDGDVGEGSAVMYAPGICLLEEPAAAITHAIPNNDNTLSGRAIIASEWDAIRTSQMHLWERGGCQILCSDWRVEPDTGTDLLVGYQTDFVKDDFGSYSSVIARAIMFPSTSSKRLRVRLGFMTTAGTDYVKRIVFQLSDSTTFATCDDTWPLYEDFTEGAYPFTTAHTSAIRVVGCELDIPSGDWEAYSAAQPLQLWAMMRTDNVEEYILPQWISAEEIPLTRTEFP
jgi:hypothetical protein